jgi:glutamate/tyrosine decarboxylase-like PLP-dependent enzyme
MAHATCPAAARHWLLARGGWNVERQGLFGAPKIRLLSSSCRHGTFERAVRLLGLGQEQVEDLAVDEFDRLLPDALERALQADLQSPAIVLLQAGDINIGAYDCFETLISIARRFGAWVHIDGAFWLWAAASAHYAHLLADANTADSWATDGHKWLNVPYDCGYAFVAHPDAHCGSMSHRAPYLVHDALIERCCAAAREIVAGIGALPGAQVLWAPRINQGLVRFLSPTSGATEEDHDRRTDEVIARMLHQGEAFFGGTTWRGKRAMRVSVCNWQTAQPHIERAIAAVAEALAATGTMPDGRRDYSERR